MCPRCEGRGSVNDFDLTQLYDDSKSLNEGALTVPGYSMDGWYGRIFGGCGFFDPDKPIRRFTKKELHDLLHKEPTKIKVDGINLTYEGLIPKIQKSMLSKDIDAMQPHIRAFVERVVTFTTCPECDGTRLSEAGPLLQDPEAEHRRRLRDADHRPGRVGGRPGRAVRRAPARHLAPHARLLRRDRAGLPLPRPARGHAVGRRVAAGQDDPPPRLVAHRHHLRVRRAHHRPAPPRHPADERPAAAAAGQGQHRARGGAQARDDRDRRPHRRPRPRRRDGRGDDLLRGHRQGPADQQDRDRAAPGRPGRPEAGGADADGRAGGARRQHRTTCRRSTSTSRSASSWWSPASPDRARAR